MDSRRLFIVVALLFAWALNVRAQQPADLNAQIVQQANFGNTAEVRKLLEAGASIEAKDRFGKTLLSVAAEMGRSETVRFLLDKGANIEAEAGGDTALNLSAESSNENTAGPVKLLLARGVLVAVRKRRILAHSAVYSHRGGRRDPGSAPASTPLLLPPAQSVS